MKQLSLDFLRTFVKVVELGSFQKAGDLLGKSQPAVSLQIKKLEQQLSKSLFYKVGQSYKANETGLWLYQQANNMLSINDDIFAQVNSEKISGRLRLGIPSEFASTLLPSIIGEFSKRYPDISLDVTSALSKQLLSDDERSKFDLILALHRPEISSQSPRDMKVLMTDQVVWVGERNYQLPNQQLPLVLAPSGCIYRTKIIEALKQQTYSWKIIYTNPDFYGLTAAIQQGLGITALALSTLPEYLKVFKSPKLPALGTVDVCLFEGKTLHPNACSALSDFIQSNLVKKRTI